MSNLQDMQNKTTEVTLGGQKFTARQLFAKDWAQVERELKNESRGINDLLSGEVSIVGYQVVVKVSIGQELPENTSLAELFEAAGEILNLDLPAEGAAPNSQQAPAKENK